MKKLTKKDKKALDEILKSTGKALIGTMTLLEIPNYLKSSYVTEKDRYYLIFRKEVIEKTSDKMLLDLGFEQKDKNKHEFFHIELDARGFTVRWIESLKDYFIEPLINPTARIKISDKMDLQDTFKLITNKFLDTTE